MTAERKFVDINAVNFDLPANYTWTPLVLINGIAPGSSASQRIGRKVNLASILLKVTARIKAGSTVGGTPTRVLVVYDKQANAAAPQITDILEADALTSANNLANRDRFVTIFDQVLDPVSLNGTFAVMSTFFKKLQLEQIFNAGPDALIGSITTGSVWITFSNAGSATFVNEVRYFSRIRYTDV